jgi:hypothetical protein
LDAIKLKWTSIYDNRPVMLFFEDEGRFGRINNVTKCWTPKGIRAVVGKQIIREYIYAYSSVCPKTGETFSLILPWSDTICMNEYLKKFAEHYNQYRIILTMDNATWHKSEELDMPENIAPFFLPPYSPELNPAEHLWDYIREQKEFNNHIFNSIDHVSDQLCKVLAEMFGEKEKVKSMTNFKWLQSVSC